MSVIMYFEKLKEVGNPRGASNPVVSGSGNNPIGSVPRSNVVQGSTYGEASRATQPGNVPPIRGKLFRTL